ncbi:SRPBCC family protein [Sporobolomyces salmoneus]|uniref:SRPBCC family protein n=1 Tax=Sporobolomyces salmoneus TaxID=183962 RepID=UPI003174A49B
MPSFAATRPVNPPGSEPALSEDQVWKGLESKARKPHLFVPAITSAEVVKDEGNKVSRLVSIHGGPKVQEDIEIHDKAILYFDFADNRTEF